MANPSAMDRPESPEDPGRSDWRNTVADVAETTQEKAQEIAKTAISKIESGRQSTADSLQGAADSLHRAADSRMGLDRVADAAHGTADRIGNVADYIEEHDASQMFKDAGSLLRRYPTQSAIAGIIVGFLAGRAFWRSSRT